MSARKVSALSPSASASRISIAASTEFQDWAPELAQAIASHPDDIESALAAYEQPLFPRSVDAAAESTRIFKLLVAENAPHSMLDFFTNHDPTQ